jgi:acyl-CoA reductase-like NAD-dependent aldehyde dehydrogenase
MLVGQQVLRYGPGCYVQAGMAMPVSGQVTRASEAAPYYGIRVDVDPKEVAAFVLEMRLQLAGGPGRPDRLERGYFVRPTVFGDVRNDMTIARDEIFGPVLSIIPYRDDDEAIAIANDTPYGLHAYVFGADLARANRVAAGIQAGRVFVNGLYDAPEAPFGGFKQSGLGREFGVFGLETYLEPKAIMGHDKAL